MQTDGDNMKIPLHDIQTKIALFNLFPDTLMSKDEKGLKQKRLNENHVTHTRNLGWWLVEDNKHRAITEDII